MTVKHWANDKEQKSIEIIDNTNVKTETVDITGSFVEYSVDFDEGSNEIVIAGRIASNNRFHIEELTLLVTPPIPPANLESILISSSSGLASVEEKRTLQLSALVKDVNGETVEKPSLTWESSNTDIATINGSGLVTAVDPGNVLIKATATRKGSVAEVQYALSVTARPAEFPYEVVLVGYETAEEPKLTIPLANGTTNLQAKVFNQYEEEMTGVSPAWESSDTAVATVSNGTLTLLEVGITTITVSVVGDPEVFEELVLAVDVSTPLVLKNITISIGTLTDGPSGTSYKTYQEMKLNGFEGMTLYGEKINNNSGIGINGGFIYNKVAFGKGISEIEITCDGGNAAAYMVVTFGTKMNPSYDTQQSSAGYKINFTATPTTDKPTFFKISSPASKWACIKSIVVYYWAEA